MLAEMAIRFKTNSSTVVRSAAWYTLSNILVKGLGFITIPVFTRVLTQEEFGIYNNYLSWLNVMTIVVTLSLESTLISAKKDYKDDLGGYVFSMMALSMTSAVVWLILASLLPFWFESIFMLKSEYVLSIFFYLIFFPIVTLFQTWERFTYKYRVSVTVSLILAIGIALLSVVLSLACPVKVDGTIIGRILPAMIIGLCILVWMIKSGYKLNLNYWRYALPIAWPFVPHLLAMTLLAAMNKIFVTRYCGADANALFSLANSCGMLVSILVTSLNNAFSPWLGDKLAQNKTEDVRRFSRPYIACFCGGAILVPMVAPEALLLLGGEDYLEAAAVIPPISMSCVLQFAYCMYVNIEQYKKRTKGMAVASLSAALINAMLDIVLIPRFGFVSAAYASVISYAWLLCSHMFLVGRLQMLDAYDNKFIIGAVSVACIFMAATSLIYPLILLRWVVLAIVIVVEITAIVVLKKECLRKGE